MNLTTPNALTQILELYGYSILFQPQRLKAILMDISPSYPGGRAVLMTLLEMGIYDQLKAGKDPEAIAEFVWQERGMDKTICNQLILLLNDYLSSERACHTCFGDRYFGFQGHSAVLDSGIFSPDGTKVLTKSVYNTAKLWDLKGNVLTTFSGHDRKVNSAVFSPDGTKVLTASEDKTAKLWDLKGNVLTTFSGHANSLNSAVFSPDGTKVLTASEDKTAKLWDREGNCLATMAGHKDAVRDCAFSPNGDKILTIAYNCNPKVWDANGNFLFDIPAFIP